MKTVPDHFAAPFRSFGGAQGGPFDSACLDKIGDDLRHHFDESLAAEMPHTLLRLAETIDARRMCAQRDENPSM